MKMRDVGIGESMLDQQRAVAILGLAAIAQKASTLFNGQRLQLRHLRQRLRQFQLSIVDAAQCSIVALARSVAAFLGRAEVLEMTVLDPRPFHCHLERGLGETGPARQR